MKNITEDFQSKCKNCDHTKDSHYFPVLDCPPFENKESSSATACKTEGCNCKKFEQEENMEKQLKNLSQKQKNSKNEFKKIWTWGDYLIARGKEFVGYETTETPTTELPKHTVKLETTFWRKPKPSPEKQTEKPQLHMSASEKIMNVIYGPNHAEINDEQYQRYKKIYLNISNKLNDSFIDSDTIVALSVISQYLFQKRNITSINKSSAVYCTEQVRLLPLRAPKFFPEIQSFLKNLNIECRPDEFDNAVIAKIDVFTQALFDAHDSKYFELKNFFFRLENCSTPLDLLLRGLFYARAKQNVRKIKWIVLGLIIAFVAGFILFGAR